MGDKYAPEPRNYEQKEWLYQEYWGNLRPIEELAEMVGVSEHTIRRNMERLGVPRRGKSVRCPESQEHVPKRFASEDSSSARLSWDDFDRIV